MKSPFKYHYKNKKREYIWKFGIAQFFFDISMCLIMLILVIVINHTSFPAHFLGASKLRILFLFLLAIFLVLAVLVAFYIKRTCDDYDEHNISTWIVLFLSLPILCFACYKSLKEYKKEVSKTNTEKINETNKDVAVQDNPSEIVG